MTEINKAIFISIVSLLKSGKEGKVSNEMVEQINQLIETTHSEIILSDSESELKKLEKHVDSFFEHNGFVKKPIAMVKDLCPQKNSRLENFIFEHDVDKFIIIDCEKINTFKARFIQCGKKMSISKQHFSTALALLN
jgi:hypothetical protein